MKDGLYYLAIPYNGSEEQQSYRTELSLKAAVEFLQQGIHVFAPVNYSSLITGKLNLSSLDNRRSVIMPYLFDFLRVSKGLILMTAEGWQDSWGVQQELRFCKDNHLPVYILAPEQIGPNMKHIFTIPWQQKELDQFLEAS